MKDIGAVLKNARENKEFTQKQVMELTGINKNPFPVMKIMLLNQIFKHLQHWLICMDFRQMKS